jgi:membrane-bound metal-dependent hydrolase YbcI (DUF457 family)
MFLGHFAVALAAKKAVPSVSLGTWCVAAQALDVLWPAFLLAGVERVKVDPGNTAVTPLDFQHYPWSHSLLMAAVWGLLFAAGHFAIKRNLKAAGLLASVVLSHWLLDFFTHRPDLPLFPGGPMAGLGLWNHKMPAVLLEFVSFAAGIFLYENSTKPLDKVGSRSLALFAIVLMVSYAGNVFGPPPPDDPQVIASVGFAMWLLFGWAYWFDRHRALR